MAHAAVSTAGRTPPTGAAAAEGRVALLEYLLGSLDQVESARRVVDWIVETRVAAKAAVLLTDRANNQLVIVAERGLPGVTDLTVDLRQEQHPFIMALASPRPHYISRDPQLRRILEADRFHAFPLRGHQDGQAVGILVTSADRSQINRAAAWACERLSDQLYRIRSRETLAETQYGQERLLLFNIINAVSDPVLLTDLEGQVLIANNLAEKLLVAPDDASEGWRRAVALNSMLFSAALSASAIEDGGGRRELLLVDPLEGSDLVYELLSSPVRDQRQGTYVVSVLRDVTDLARAKVEIDESYRTLRLAQAKVREERHRLDLIIDSVADPILVTDPDGGIVLMNAPAEKMFAPAHDGTDAAARRVRANGANLTSFVATLLASGTQDRYRSELTLTDPGTGSVVPFEAIAGTILAEQGELMWVVTILHDLTEAIEKGKLYEQLKRASEELEVKVHEATAELAEQNELLRRQHIALEQASALKSQFLANMSHEFRTPLNAILGYTHMTLQGVAGEMSPGQRRNLTRIDSNARHLLGLINDILDITRIEAGRMPLNISRFGVDDLVQEVMLEMEPIIARRAQLEVVAKIPPSLPAVRSDRQKVKQVVLNLLSNALKFTEDGGVYIRATYDARARSILVVVRDTGIGIARADQSHVFEDFRQLDSSPSRGHGGTGLGLPICRRLAQMLDGGITLESQMGKGSTFTLRLPVKPKRR
ncbi:MAG TPA: ATP-binding protein [Vicinamibacterales bacterium]|nr:ATP-binding protein [Vicinamibacterales bacterium]